MKEKIRIPKLVIIPSEVDDKSMFALNLNDNVLACRDCNSNLFYVKIEWGVVAEENSYGIMGNKSNRQYVLREIGFVLYCAECGEFEENFVKWFYPEDKVVCQWDEINGAERAEIEYSLRQFDQKGDFTPMYKCPEVNLLKEKLKEYEKKYPDKPKKITRKKKQS